MSRPSAARPAGVIRHPLSSSSLPGPCAELISLLTHVPTSDERFKQRLTAVESAVTVMQRRIDMETRCQCDLGPKTSLLCNLVRSCLIGSPIGMREYIGIVQSRQPEPAVNSLTGVPPDSIEVALLAYVHLESANQAPGPTRTVTTSSVPDSPPDDPRTDVGASEPRSEFTDGSLSNEFPPAGPEFSRILLAGDTSDTDFASVLVMTGEPHIYSAIASMLYHRTSLGLEGPVLGLSYSSDGRRLHLIFAWLGKSDRGLAPIHVAHDAFGDQEGRGTFDATDLKSCINILHFLTSAHKRLIQVGKKSPTGNILWRADQVPLPDTSGGIGSTKKHIKDWISHVTTTDTGDPAGMVPAGLPREELIHADTLSERPPSSPSGNSHMSFEQPLSRLSFDAFARGHEETASDWLFDRGCVQDTRLHHFRDNYEALLNHALMEPRDIEQFAKSLPLFKAYDDATRFRWNSKVGLPGVPPHLNKLRDNFSLAVDNHLTHELSHVGEVADLDAIQKHFVDLLCVRLRAEFRGGDIRSQFDALHDSIFGEVLGSNDVIILPILHPMLRLPRNDQADRRLRPIMGPTLLFQMAMSGNTQSHPLRFSRTILKDLRSTGRETRQKLSREAKASTWFAANYNAWMFADFAEAELRRTQDPEVGKCDSLCVVKVGGVIPASLQAQFNEINIVLFPDTHEQDDFGAFKPPLSEALLLPLLVSQHRTNDPIPNYDFAPRKLRMLLTAAVKFLVALDVWNFPVFGLITKGAVGIVVAAWAEPGGEDWDLCPPVVRILERSCCLFDLATPLGAFHYTTFLSWLQDVHAKALVEAFDDTKRANFLKRLESGDENIKWAMAPHAWEALST